MKLHERIRELAWGIPITILSKCIRRHDRSWALLIDDKQRYEGNIRALASYLSQQDDTTVTLLDYRTEKAEIPALPAGIEVVAAHSLAEMRVRLKAKNIVFSHAHSKTHLNGRYAAISGLNRINVWHGVPLKALGNLIPGYRRGTLRKRLKEGRAFHTFCVSSALEKTFFAGCYFFDASRIAITGIPRNDALANPDAWDCRQRALIEEISVLKKGRAMILYAPTWRDYDRTALGFRREDCERLSQLMVTHNTLFAFRPHPLDNELFTQLIAGLPNLVLANPQRWEDTAAVLACSDALVNDYSSIMVDYLLLRRPIVGYFWDFARYRESRGFLFDLPALFPGPIAKDIDSLFAQLLQIIENGMQAPATEKLLHERMLALFHEHQDGRACERIVQRVYQAADQTQKRTQNNS